MFNHVIVPVDCTAAGRRDAERIARFVAPLDGAKVTLIASITPSIDPVFRAKKVSHSEQALSEIAAIMLAHGIRTRRRVLEGRDAASALAEEAHSIDDQYDLFVLGVHQTQSEIDESPCLGSLADQLAKRTHLPILILSADM